MIHMTMDKLKILILTPCIPYPPDSGANHYMWKRIEHLHEKGHKLYIFAGRKREKDRRDYRVLESCCEKLTLYTNSFMNILYRPFSPLYVARNCTRKMKKDIAALVNRERIDLIICEFLFMVANIQPQLPVPVILSQHNLEHQRIGWMARSERGLMKWLLLLESRRLRTFEERLVRSQKITAFSFISESDKERFEDSYGRGNTFLLPAGFDVTDREPSEYTPGKIVFVGKMSYAPNIEAVKWFCRSIFTHILAQSPDAQFFIIGRNPTREVLSLASDSIIVTGAVADISSLITDAHLYVLPLKSGGGVKIKAIEAFATGNIVVSTDIGVEGTRFKPDVHFLLANDEGGFIEKCISVLKNREKYVPLARNAVDCVREHHSWDKVLKIYDEHITNIVTECENEKDHYSIT